MVDIPLISKNWKKQRTDEEEELLGQAMQEGYNQATMDADEELLVRNPPTPEDNNQFWRGVFNPTDVEGSGLAKKILPSLGTSFYSNDPTFNTEARPFLSRLKYLKMGIIDKWIKRWEERKEAGLILDEDSKQGNPFIQEFAMILAKLDADLRNRLSLDMVGLKEVNSKRGYMERGQKGPQQSLDQKLGVR